ncbi:MAG: hypothetical protein RBU37_00625 [Myxococcota bacterium]|nr:hypothetical protein [Myxococcota bacterium]
MLAPLDDEGNKHGVVTYWRPDGSLVNRCQFEHGVPHGWYERYHQSGEVSRKGHFVQGKLHGTDTFIRSQSPSTESFPRGLSELVWRAELEMQHGAVIEGRCFDQEGRQVSETGEPLPERPERVPANAVFSAKTQRWLCGSTDDTLQRHGTWRFFERDGALCQLSIYEHGEELSSEHYDSEQEAAVALALHENRLEDARSGAQTLLQQATHHAERVLAAALLARTQASAEALTELASQVEAWTDAPEALGAPFMPSTRKAARAAATVLAAAAQTLDAAQADRALRWLDRALRLHRDTALQRQRFERLRQLGRDEDAHAQARRILIDDPSAPGFESLLAEPAFQDWLQSISTEAMTVEGAAALLGHAGARLQELAEPILEARQTDARADDDEDEEEEEDNEDEGNAELDAPWPISSVLGERLAPELQAWLALCAELRTPYRGAFVAACESTLSAAVATQDGTWIARLQSIFFPASAVLIGDEELLLAEWFPDEYGNSRVFYQHQDEPTFYPNEGALAALLCTTMLSDSAFEDLPLPEALRARWQRAATLLLERQHQRPSYLDLEQLGARTHWVVELLLGIELGDGLGGAPGLEVYEAERDAIADWPHLQAYWLFHHIVFDNLLELDELRSRCDARYPAVKELLELASDRIKDSALPFCSRSALQALRLKAYAAERRELFSPDALQRLEARSAPLREAQRKMDAAKAALEASTLEASQRAFGLWKLLESAAGQFAAFEEHALRHTEEDPNTQVELLLSLRRGQISFLPGWLEAMGALLRECLPHPEHGHWLALAEAAFERGAAAGDDDEACVPGVLFVLGFLLEDFDAIMKRVENTVFFQSGELGRRRRLELVMLADAFLQSTWAAGGDSAQRFLHTEAERFARQFSEWQTDTYPRALFALLERGDAEGMALFNETMAAASFSGANWTLAMRLVERCGELKLQGVDDGLWAALSKGLGRHDDGDRAKIVVAYARCASDRIEAQKRLEARLASFDGSRKACERAALVAGLCVLEAEGCVEKARAALSALLEGRMGSMELGAAVSLLHQLDEQKLSAFEDLGRFVWERAKGERHTKAKHLQWLGSWLGIEATEAE